MYIKSNAQSVPNAVLGVFGGHRGLFQGTKIAESGFADTSQWLRRELKSTKKQSGTYQNCECFCDRFNLLAVSETWPQFKLTLTAKYLSKWSQTRWKKPPNLERLLKQLAKSCSRRCRIEVRCSYKKMKLSNLRMYCKVQYKCACLFVGCYAVWSLRRSFSGCILMCGGIRDRLKTAWESTRKSTEKQDPIQNAI